MKLLVYALMLSVLPISFLMAQTSPASTTRSTTNRPAVRPPATRPATADTTGATSNRRQELYDQHHGITRKPNSPTPVPAPVVSQAEPQQPQAGNADRPQPAPTADQPARQPERIEYSDASISGVRIGIRGGVNYPVYTENDPLTDPVLSFVGGLVLNVGAGLFSFQPEVNYARTSIKLADFGAGSLTRSVDQIQVPLFLKISSGSYAGSRFFLNVGPYGAYTSSASLNGKKISIDGNEGRFSYGAAAGIGAALKAGPGHVTVEVRGYYQLGDNAKPSSGTSSIIPAQATLGYSFPLGGR